MIRPTPKSSTATESSGSQPIPSCGTAIATPTFATRSPPPSGGKRNEPRRPPQSGRRRGGDPLPVREGRSVGHRAAAPGRGAPGVHELGRSRADPPQAEGQPYQGGNHARAAPADHASLVGTRPSAVGRHPAGHVHYVVPADGDAGRRR